MALRFGDEGAEVEQVQRDLIVAGFDPGMPDGRFGDRTEAAVRAFQEAVGLDVDGVFGPASAEALGRLLQDDRHDGDLDHVELSAIDEPDLSRPSPATEFPEYFDNWDGELASRWRTPFYLHEASGKTLAWKGRPTPIDLSARTHLCVHNTAVEFGTSASRRRRWLERIRSGEITEETLARYSPADGEEAAAERMALHERFWTVAYHWVGLRNGDVLFNNAPERYTYHGNSSNRFAIGVSVEAELPARAQGRTAQHTEITPDFVETNRTMLRLAVSTGREAGAPLTHVTAHRCFSMTREGDPGEEVWKEIVIPVAEEMGLEIDYALVDGGRPIPHDWDPSSSVDWQGRPIV